MAKAFEETRRDDERQLWPPKGGSGTTNGTKVTMENLSSNYMDLNIGKGVEFTVKEVLKVAEDKYYFKDNNNQAINDPETGKPFKYLIIDEDGERLSVNTWMLWNLLRQAFTDFGRIEGIQLRIDHPDRGQYHVSYFNEKENSWKKIEPRVKKQNEEEE